MIVITEKKLIAKHTVPSFRLDWIGLGKELREIRISKGKSLRWMARNLHISAPYLSDMERGNRNFKLNLIAPFLTLTKSK